MIELAGQSMLGKNAMKLFRRDFLRLAAASVVLPALRQPVRAETYPTKPVRFIVPVPPAGTFDIVGRLVANALSQRLGQQLVVENRGGAGTNLGTAMVAHATPDGYTLLLAGSPGAINATLYHDLDFSFARDIAPVASIERAPLIMVVNPAFPAKTVPEFISYAKTNPGKINMGSGGIGSTGHVAGELFNMMAGLKMAHVPYRGAGRHRSARRPDPGDIFHAWFGYLQYQVGHAARPGRHQRHAHGRCARRAGDSGIVARLRSSFVGRHWRAGAYAARDH
jgi:hypothetical protein